MLDELVAILLEKGYQGLDVDFEYIAREDRAAFLAFLGNAGNGYTRWACRFT